MKTKEKEMARDMRKKGYTMTFIQNELDVSISSVYKWTKDLDIGDYKIREMLSRKGNPNVEKNLLLGNVAKKEQARLRHETHLEIGRC